MRERFSKPVRYGAWMLAAAAVFLGSHAEFPGKFRATPSVSAQQPSERAADVFLPAPRPLRQRLSRAETALREQRYSDAVLELGAVLTDADAEQGLAQDYFLEAAAGQGAQRSVKAEAQRLLGSMPEKGRELYELQFGGDARSLLDEAVTAGDFQKLSEVTRRFFHTQAGYEATFLLGRVQLDHGRPLAAALCFQRLLDSPAAAKMEPELSVLLATCWMQANMPEKAQATLVELHRRVPGAQVRIAGRDVPLFSQPARAIDWLKELVGPAQAARAQDVDQWVMHRGDTQRNARSNGGLPLTRYRWRVPSTDDPSDERDVANATRQFDAQDIPAIPALQPLAVGDVVLMRTPRRLMAVDFVTGKRIWDFPWFDVTSEPSSTNEVNLGDLKQLQLTQRIWDDAAYGQMSSDGRSVFLLHEMAHAGVQVQDVIMLRGGFPQMNEDLPRTFNKLVALDIQSQGKLRWIVGGENGEDEPKLAGVFFLGTPLPLLGDLYVLGETNAEIRLFVLDADTGRLKWSQQLAHVDVRTIQVDSGRRLAGAVPSFSDGVLVCPTSAGAVVAVDITTRSLLWGYQYKQFQSHAGRFGLRGPGPFQAAQLGQRWNDCTVTIVDGRVLLTPVESDELFCLDLLTGEPVWPAKSRGELLYVACVHGGNLITVGKERVVAYKLHDGNEAWPAPIELGEALVSGRGFYSDHFYYLPTNQAELLKIDLTMGQVVERIQTGETLGNLVCYKDHIISQGPQWLLAFHQIEPLRQLTAKRLRQNPNDADALTHLAELQLHDGQRTEALATLRRAHQLQPEDDAVRMLLVSTLLDALRENFAANRSMAQEVEQLIDQPDQRFEYLRLMATGLHQSGEAQAAFDMYLKLVDADYEMASRYNDPTANLQQVEENLRVRRERWLQARIGELIRAATPDVRRHIDNTIQQRWEAAQNIGSHQALHRFVTYFGGHPLAHEARLQLATRLIDNRELLEAELHLSELQHASDPLLRATASLHLARLLEEAERFDAAAAVYRNLAATASDLRLDGEQTGQQVFEDARQRPSVARYLVGSRDWPHGAVTVAQAEDQLQRESAYQQRQPVPLETGPGPLPSSTQLIYEMSREGALELRDGQGNSWLRLGINSMDRRPMANGRLAHAKANGHLMVLFIDGELLAVDALQARQRASEAVLWRADLAGSVPGRAGQNSIHSRQVTNPWGETRSVATDTKYNPLGMIGPVGPNGVVYLRQRELVCVHPFTGEIIWARSNIRPGATLFGDSQYLFVIEPGSSEALVLSPVDGQILGKRTIDAQAQRWQTCGRNVLSWTDKGDLHVVLRDVWADKDLYQAAYPQGSRGQVIGSDEVAIMRPDGRLHLISLRDGRVIADQQLQAEPNLLSLHVVATSDSYLVLPNRGVTRGRDFQAAPDSSSSRLVSGFLYSLSRSTGQPRWQVPAYIENYGLPVQQPADLPVLVLMRQRPMNSQTQQNDPRASILCLDKRDGRVVLSQDDLRLHLSNFELAGNPSENVITLTVPEKTFTLKFTDEPQPPAPPAQLGELSSLNTVERRVKGLAGAILGAFGLPPSPEAEKGK